MLNLKNKRNSMRTRLPIQTLQLVRACMVCMLVSAPNAFASTSDPLTEKYRISPEDVINISVWREEDMQREVVVRPDGGISFPLAGDIAAAGKTTVELEKILTARLHKYIPDAVVTVSMTQIQGLRIYVTGKVRSPGQFTVGRYIDVLQAITLAGGLTPFADQGDIRIMRRSDNGIHVLPFNYGQVEKGKNLKQNVILQTDDVVVVP